MKQLDQNQQNHVSGGADHASNFVTGGATIVAIALMTPTTAPLALIGLAMIYVGAEGSQLRGDAYMRPRSLPGPHIDRPLVDPD